MAYFSNSSDGSSFDEQCGECRYGKGMCPIHCIQLNYNYSQVGNKIAEEILGYLVKNNGTCEMFEMFKKDFQLCDGEKRQMEMF